MSRSMKSVFKVITILLLVGALLFGTGLAFGARPVDIWSNADLRIPFFVSLGGPSVSVSSQNGYASFESDYSADGSYSVPASAVTALDLSWVVGSVTVRYADVSDITFRESARDSISQEHALRWNVDSDGLLRIQYCAAGTIVGLPDKNLELQLPREMENTLSSFCFDGASAELEVDGVAAEEVTLKSSAGALRYTGDCGTFSSSTSSGLLCYIGSAEHLKAFSSSGAITLRGGVTSDADISSTSGEIQIVWDASPAELEIGSSSGAVSFTGNQVPESLSLTSTSGAVTMTLSANADFTLDYDTASGEFSGTLPIRVQDGHYLSGDGSADLHVNTSSGDLTLNAK